MLKQRVITGACIAAVMAVILVFSYQPAVIMIFASLLSVIAIYELYQVSGMLKKKGFARISFVVSLIWAAGFVFLPISFHLPLLAGVFGLSMLVSGWNMWKFGKYQLKKSGIIFVISLVFPILYSSMAYVRAQENGLLYLILIVISCFVTDTGAYFVGRACGKHKLAPVISPKKTVEGFVGGIAINVVVYLIVGLILQFGLQTPVSLPMLAILAVVCGVLDQFGDLSMSAIKRNFEVKDFGNLMPGHGGVLDRFDSLLYVGAFVYIFIMWIHPLYI